MKSYRTRERTDHLHRPWASGPWDNEDDKYSWTDEKTGLPCLIVRNHSGALCGYVGVTEEHPLFGQSYNEAYDLDVHGGLTFSDACDPEATEEEGICHVPEPGASDHVWWFGFDCAHSGDQVPVLVNYDRYREGGTYRTVDYVQGECRKLAEQLIAVKS